MSVLAGAPQTAGQKIASADGARRKNESRHLRPLLHRPPERVEHRRPDRVCGEWCAREGLTVAARFEDQGISGAALGNRPGALAMLQAAQSGAFDVLLVMDLSRLSRLQADLSKMIDRLTARGIRVDRRAGRLRQRAQGPQAAGGAVGHHRRGVPGDGLRRTYTALQSPRHAGTSGGREALRLCGRRGGEVRQVFEWYADGHSPQWIAAELNARRRPRRARRGTAQVVAVVAGIRRRSGATRSAASAS